MKDGDVLAQIETDKVTIDVKYTDAQPGVVSKVLIKEEDTVEVGQECFVVDVGASGGKEPGSAGEPPKQEAPKEEKPKEEKKAEAPKKEQPQPPPEKPKPAEQPKQQPKQPAPTPAPSEVHRTLPSAAYLKVYSVPPPAALHFLFTHHDHGATQQPTSLSC